MSCIGLVMVVQSHFLSQDFAIDHKFSMGLRSGDFQAYLTQLIFVS